MTTMHRITHFLAPLAMAASLASPLAAQAQDFGSFFSSTDLAKPLAGFHPPCRGKVKQVQDIVFEGVKTTAFNWAAVAGGGESGRFDPVPVLSTKVNLTSGCLNAHFSAMVGSKISYPFASSITMFQVTLTPSGGGLPMHMAGHYETPYGIYGPAVALSAEHDVDMLASNFYQGIGIGNGLIPPGPYQVDVWWSGGPVGGGGAIGADFVLKLYQY
jgi:hypothetical protein